jgi:uncharacterized membrane protein YeaQ/YmgE (transglycosylase-associated protein family)
MRRVLSAGGRAAIRHIQQRNRGLSASLPNQPFGGVRSRIEQEATMDAESLVIFIIVGIVAGWIAGQVVRGGGFGLLGDLVVGVVGALIAGFLFPAIGVSLGGGIIGAILTSAIGAIILLLILRLVRRA